MSLAVRAIPWALILIAAACGADAGNGQSSTCVADNPPGEPFDVGDVDPIGLSPDSPGVKPTVRDITGYCQEARAADCDPGRLMSRAAAACISASEGFDEGRDPWRIQLGFFQNFERMAWSVEGQITETATPGLYTQRHLIIDAISAEVLSRNTASVQF